MENRTINLYANNQTLVIDKVIEIVSDTENYIYANVDLGENWQSFDSVRVIWSHGVDVPMVLNNGRCKVPADVIADMGVVKVNLVGSNVENDVLVDRLTTEQIPAILVKQNVPIDGTNPQEITPSQFEQFVEAVKDDADRAEQSASEAETSAQNASDSATSAHNSAESAHDDKIAIEQAIAEVIQQIEDFEQVQVVVNTLPPSSQATSDFTDGVLTLGIPQGVKGDTGNGIQSITKTGTSGLVDTYTITFTDGQTTTFNVTNGAKGDTGNGIQSIAKTSTVGLVDTYTITYTDGTTSTFTVTNGEKGDKGDTGEVSLSELEDATVVQTLSDSTPYNYRRTNGGNGSGHREYDEIVGCSVGWNQLVPNTNKTSKTENGITFTVNADGSVTLNGTATADATFSYGRIDTIKDHKYAVVGIPSGASSTGHKVVVLGTMFADTIRSISADDYWTSRIIVTNGTTVTNVRYNPLCIDLTLALGSTIADYIYSLEQATAGSGVTWLKSHFPKLFDNGYMSYDSGSIKSVSGLTAHEMVGKNQFDQSAYTSLERATYEDGKFNSTYLATATGIMVRTYKNGATVNTVARTDWAEGTRNSLLLTIDDTWDTMFIGIRTNVVDNIGAYYPKPELPNGQYVVSLMVDVKNTTTVKGAFSDVQIEIGSTATDFEPYEKHTYPLDSSVTLRGQYKLDANNNLYADGDVYPSSGEIGREYNELDLGSLTYTKSSYITNGFVAIDGMPDDFPVAPSTSAMPNWVCLYEIRSNAGIEGSSVDKAIAWKVSGNNKGVIIRDSAYATYYTDNDMASFKQAMSGKKLVYEKATSSTDTATPYTNPQWCDPHGTEEYVSTSIVPIGHNTDYPMTLIDTMPTANGNYTMKLNVASGKKTITWQSV